MRPTSLMLCCLAIPALLVLMLSSSAEAQFGIDGGPPPLTVKLELDQNILANRKKLAEPVQLELEAGTTLKEAVLKLAAQAELEVEFEGDHLQGVQATLAETIDEKIAVDVENFDTALAFIASKMMQLKSQDQEPIRRELKSIQYRLLAIPTETGILVTGEVARTVMPLPMEQRSHDISDLSVQIRFDQEIRPLIENRISVIWLNPKGGEDNSTPVLVYRGLENGPHLSSKEYSPICTMQAFYPGPFVLMNAPRSVHYQVEELLYDLRVELKAHQPIEENRASKEPENKQETTGRLF